LIVSHGGRKRSKENAYPLGGVETKGRKKNIGKAEKKDLIWRVGGEKGRSKKRSPWRGGRGVGRCQEGGLVE